MTCNRVLDEKIFRVLHERLFEDVIDRSKCEIPDTFVPSAKLIALGNDLLLYSANPLAYYGTNTPYRWIGRVRSGLFRMVADPYILEVRRYGNLWGIERVDGPIHEVLAFAYGPTLIFHRQHQAAMTLAKDCHPKPREEAQCMSWVPIAA
jgi:hypothetical protein